MNGVTVERVMVEVLVVIVVIMKGYLWVLVELVVLEKMPVRSRGVGLVEWGTVNEEMDRKGREECVDAAWKGRPRLSVIVSFHSFE